MYTLYSRILYLCRINHLTIYRLEKILNFGNGTITRWQTSNPHSKNVLKVADFFHVSLDYIIGLNDRKR